MECELISQSHSRKYWGRRPALCLPSAGVQVGGLTGSLLNLGNPLHRNSYLIYFQMFFV